MLLGLLLMLQVAFVQPQVASAAPSVTSTFTTVAATPAECKSATLFGLPAWYKYLPDDNFASDCSITDKFVLLGKGSNSSLILVVLALVDILLRVAALVAVIFVIVAGFKFMTAWTTIRGSEPEHFKSAIRTMVGAITGLIISLIAVAVVSFIGNRLT